MLILGDRGYACENVMGRKVVNAQSTMTVIGQFSEAGLHK